MAQAPKGEANATVIINAACQYLIVFSFMHQIMRRDEGTVHESLRRDWDSCTVPYMILHREFIFLRDETLGFSNLTLLLFCPALHARIVARSPNVLQIFQ